MQIPKNKRIRLKGKALKDLFEKVIKRDGWECQAPFCRDLHYRSAIDVPHHIKFRSQGGSDVEENLITCCRYCHRFIHANNIKISGGPGAWEFSDRKLGH